MRWPRAVATRNAEITGLAESGVCREVTKLLQTPFNSAQNCWIYTKRFLDRGWTTSPSDKASIDSGSSFPVFHLGWGGTWSTGGRCSAHGRGTRGSQSDAPPQMARPFPEPTPLSSEGAPQLERSLRFRVPGRWCSLSRDLHHGVYAAGEHPAGHAAKCSSTPKRTYGAWFVHRAGDRVASQKVGRYIDANGPLAPFAR